MGLNPLERKGSCNLLIIRGLGAVGACAVLNSQKLRTKKILKEKLIFPQGYFKFAKNI